MFNKGITTVLTLSTLAMDTRTDLPKVHYATALDWFILITFGYCMASIIQFASVHYFTKVIFVSFSFTAESTDMRLDSFELNQSVHYISEGYSCLTGTSSKLLAEGREFSTTMWTIINVTKKLLQTFCSQANLSISNRLHYILDRKTSKAHVSHHWSLNGSFFICHGV